jgi:hypothetical protein
MPRESIKVPRFMALGVRSRLYMMLIQKRVQVRQVRQLPGHRHRLKRMVNRVSGRPLAAWPLLASAEQLLWIGHGNEAGWAPRSHLGAWSK